MSALARQLRHPRLLGPALWAVVCALSVAVAWHWLREAAATPPPAPAAPAHPAVDLDAAVARAAAVPLFGEAPPHGPVASTGGPAIDIKLKGVLAGRGGPAAAIVNTGGDEDELAMLGAELRPGVRLESVQATYIVLSRDGVGRRVELEPLRSEPSRSKGGARAGGKPTGHSPPPPEPVEAEASAANAEPAPEQPLAPPMPQSSAAPDSLVPVA